MDSDEKPKGDGDAAEQPDEAKEFFQDAEGKVEDLVDNVENVAKTD